MKLDRRIDKGTGLEKWWLGDLLAVHPVLKKPGKFLVGKVRLDGALTAWVVKFDKTGMWETGDIHDYESCYIPRTTALKAVSDLESNGWIVFVYAKNQQDKIQEHLKMSKTLLKSKTIGDMLKVISESGIVGRKTPDEIWNSLPKFPLMALAELYARARLGS
jgi:hypothetical protein